MSNHNLSVPVSQNNPTPPHRLSIGTILLPVAVWFSLLGLIFAVLYMGSFRAVGGNIHAVALDRGAHIHGKDLDCSFGPGHRLRNCTIMLDGQPLSITAQSMGPPLPAISGCTATFAGAPINCTQAYVTSSYWAYGVKIDDDAVAAAAAVEAGSLRTWRTLLLDRGESAFAQATLAALGTATLIAVFVVPGLVERRNSAEKAPLPFKPVFYGLSAIIVCAFAALSATMGMRAGIVLLQRFGLPALLVGGLFALVSVMLPNSQLKTQASGLFLRAIAAIVLFIIGGYMLMGSVIWLEYID